MERGWVRAGREAYYLNDWRVSPVSRAGAVSLHRLGVAPTYSQGAGAGARARTGRGGRALASDERERATILDSTTTF